jgi:hypothetical protein
MAAAGMPVCGLALDDAVYQPTRELPAKWVAGHFQSEPFWITWRASRYVIGLELPDTRVWTEDHPVDSLDRHYTQRCGQPFPDGVTWSVRHFGRVIARHTSQIAPWCEDVSEGHTLRAGIGTFRAWPGPGYTIRIEPPRWAPAEGPFRLPLRLSMWTQTGGESGFGLPAVLLVYFLVSLGIVGVPLGTALLIMERFRITERFREYLERKRQST